MLRWLVITDPRTSVSPGHSWEAVWLFRAALGGDGGGALILNRFGMPTQLIAERQFDLSFLNTGIDALALVLFGAGLATVIFAGQGNSC